TLPSASSCWRDCASRSASRSHSATDAPEASMRFAAARPMPRAPPVMTATRICKLFSLIPYPCRKLKCGRHLDAIGLRSFLQQRRDGRMQAHAVFLLLLIQRQAAISGHADVIEARAGRVVAAGIGNPVHLAHKLVVAAKCFGIVQTDKNGRAPTL